MSKTFTVFIGFLSSLVLILLEQSNFLTARSPLFNFISVLAYSIIGTTVLFAAYRIIDWILPADVEREIFENRNVAAAIFKGLFLLGVAVIIAAVIVAP